MNVEYPCNPRIDMQRLFAEGASPFLVSRQHYAVLQALINQEQWVDDPGGVYRKVPAWAALDPPAIADKAEREQAIKDMLESAAPAGYRDAINAMMADTGLLGALQQAWRFHCRSVHLWNGAEDLPWHWDGPDQAPMFLLMYFSPHRRWPAENGGHLQIGIRELGGNWLSMPEAGSVELVTTVPPAHRCAVLCNNQDPRYVHQVVPLGADVDRVTILAPLEMIRQPLVTPI